MPSRLLGIFLQKVGGSHPLVRSNLAEFEVKSHLIFCEKGKL